MKLAEAGRGDPGQAHGLLQEEDLIIDVANLLQSAAGGMPGGQNTMRVRVSPMTLIQIPVVGNLLAAQVRAE